MRIIRLIEGKPATDRDAWTRVGDEDAIPAGTAAIVTLARWQADRDDLARRNLPLGIRLASHEALEEVAGDLERFALIALDFPNLNDGRHYTTARLLRERYGFSGEIRATGQVLRDQLFAMARCGFDSFELAPHQDAGSAHEAFAEVSVVYQPAADGRLPAPVLRSAGGGRYAVSP
jgi:uncharacterized protein (DUF934 family)